MVPAFCAQVVAKLVVEPGTGKRNLEISLDIVQKKCTGRLIDWLIEQAKSNWLHLFDFSPGRFVEWVLKMPVCWVAYSHWLHWLDFSPTCVFRCVLKLPAWDYVFSYVSFIHLDQSMHSHTGCICLTFLHCAFPNVYSKSLDQRRQSHTGCIFFRYSHTVYFQKPPEIACLKEGIFTSVAFIWHPPLCVFKCLLKVFE